MSTFRLSLLETILQDCNQDAMGEREFKQALIQVAQGLKYIQSFGLAHLDIKPGSIFNSFRSNEHLGYQLQYWSMTGDAMITGIIIAI